MVVLAAVSLLRLWLVREKAIVGVKGVERINRIGRV
jgi:hypothetical protein